MYKSQQMQPSTNRQRFYFSIMDKICRMYGFELWSSIFLKKKGIGFIPLKFTMPSDYMFLIGK